MDLIARLEAAEGPSRDLDAEIERVLDPSIVEYSAGTLWRRCRRDDGGFFGGVPRPFTASIDLAATLANGEWINIGDRWHQIDDKQERRAYAKIELSREPYIIGAFGATYALALCAAALKIREKSLQPEQCDPRNRPRLGRLHTSGINFT